MKYNILGRTGIKVSELCFGILPMGPLQADMPADEGGELLLSAMEPVSYTHLDVYKRQALAAANFEFDSDLFGHSISGHNRCSCCMCTINA